LRIIGAKPMGLLRNALLAGSQSRWLRERATRSRAIRRAVSRFMPGEDLEAALAAVRGAGESGAGAVLTCLGENLSAAVEAAEVERHYLQALDRIHHLCLDAEISVKLTQLGLDFSRGDCEKHVVALAERAAALGNWIWIDMESSAYTDPTLEIYRRVRERHSNVGVCVQSYLRRTAQDLDALIGMGAGVRLVKGAYKEPAGRAFPRKADVDANYFSLARALLNERARAAGVRAIFGTHDPDLIHRIEELGRSRGLSAGSLEFQMLYGIRVREQARLARLGYRFRVLISYGDAWFPWYMRRLAERPANVLFVLRSLFAG
jgi:proline dehydrogenase